MGEQSSEYWRERFRQLEEAQYDTSAQTVHEIEQQFIRSQQVLDEKINAWYQRFAANNEISMIEARRLLNTDELEEFHWNVEEYIEYGRKNAIDPRWTQQLENASARVHVSRLESLKIQTQQEMEKLFGNYSDAVDKHISDVYTSSYYHSAFEVQKGIGVGWDMQKLNEEKVSDIIHKPWAADGRNFSDRIWTSKTTLINNLHDSLTRMCITGESPDRAIRELAKNMGVSRSQAANIIQTESAAFSAKAQENCYAELDIEEFEVVETLDSHTCSMCGDMDGKHFPMKDYQIGVTVPPFHPRCRGCTCPHFDDEFTTGERIARGADGKQYYVPEKMTFNEWKKSFVNGGDKSGLTPATSGDTMAVEDIDKQITDLKKQFSDLTDGYSYDDWFSDFSSIEEGYGEVSDGDTSFNSLKELDQKIKSATQKRAELEPPVTTRKQIDAGHGKVPDEELNAFNEKAYQSILEETGYSEAEAQEFHQSMQYYFGGNYEAFTTGQAPKETAIIDIGLSKMQPYDGEIYRGMGFLEDAVDDYEKFRTVAVGAELPMRSTISSWTSTLESSYGFGGLPEAYRDTVLIRCVKNKTSIGVQHISKFRDVEAEVLARSDARWVVKKVTTRSSYDAYKDYLETLDGKNKEFCTNYLKDAESDFRSHLYTVIEVEEL